LQKNAISGEEVICRVLQVLPCRAEISGAKASARNVRVVEHNQRQDGRALHHP